MTAHTIKIVREVLEEGGAFIALLDNDRVRIGYRNLFSVDTPQTGAINDILNVAPHATRERFEEDIEGWFQRREQRRIKSQQENEL